MVVAAIEVVLLLFILYTTFYLNTHRATLNLSHITSTCSDVEMLANLDLQTSIRTGTIQV